MFFGESRQVQAGKHNTFDQNMVTQKKKSNLHIIMNN